MAQDSTPAGRPAAARTGHRSAKSTLKETLTQIVLAFAMAFTFRGFVIEAFVIPTGSMAPTLLGQHSRHVGDRTGFGWTVGPIGAVQNEGPRGRTTVSLADPMSNLPQSSGSAYAGRAGDRLFVLKYVDTLFEPRRWDVPVFKVPTTGRENYIKRLVGVPNEQLALVDGDVFVRPTATVWDEQARRWRPDPSTGFSPGDAERGVDAWGEPGWEIARKPERVQRAIWQTVFDSRYTPVSSAAGLPATGFNPPWAPTPDDETGWSDFRASGVYRHEGAGDSGLIWTGRSGRYYQFEHGLSDQYPYNFGVGQSFQVFPVSDLALSLGIAFDEPDPDRAAIARLTARGMRLEAEVRPDRVMLRLDGPDGPIAREATLDRPALVPGRVTAIEFWHVDQALWLFVDGRLALGGIEGDGAFTYDLTPAQRVEAATGTALATLIPPGASATRNPLRDPDLYRTPAVAWSFSGGPLTLHRVAARRDIHYQPVNAEGVPAPGGGTERLQRLATHPHDTPTLGPDHFFLCGDNSPNSSDSRRWSTVAPEVSAQLEGVDPADGDPPLAGPVHRRLLVGRAFVVYLPSPRTVSDRLPFLERLPMLDFGTMRWVW